MHADDYLDCMHADTPTTVTTGGNALPPDDQIAYRVSHAAAVIDMSERQMWELVRTGEIESFKIGASRRIPRSALVAYIEAARQQDVAS